MQLSKSSGYKAAGVHRYLAGIAAIGLALITPISALAHPLGNFSVNYYSRIELAPGAARIYYVMDWAEVPTFQLKKTLDTNSDGQVDDGELRAYTTTRSEELRKNLTLTADGATITLTARDATAAFAAGQGGLDTLRLTMWLDGALPTDKEKHQITFADKNDTERLGWREILVRAGSGVAVSDANVSDKDVSDELRTYPEDLLSSPLRLTEATFTIINQAGAGSVEGTSTGGTKIFGATSRDSQFSALIDQRELTPQVIAASIATALVLGALHALEPGHGKSVAAAYLVGSRATPRHAVLLGGTITITHTISVFLLGLITLFASSFIVPERLFPYLGLFSAFIVIVMGIQLIVNAVRTRNAAAAEHAHEFDASTNELMHSHGGKQHKHVPPTKMNARSVMAVGVSGGLVPCPAALVVLLSSIALGRVGFGMLLIVIFSIGLAGVLTLISLLVVYGKRLANTNSFVRGLADKLPSSGRAAMLLPIMSGVLVLFAGFYLIYLTLPFLQLL